MTETSKPLRPSVLAAAVFAASFVFFLPELAHAYVGPGAGVAAATTVLALVVSIVVTILGLLFWPIRFVYKLIRRKKPPNPPKIRRAVLVGLDGLDPKLVRRFMEAGKLPNMKKLADKGTFKELGTTFPAMSPVAWSSFATGVNPAKHGIFDFLTRDRASYMPDLSSADVKPPKKHLEVGNLRIPIGKPQLKLLRRSKPFWEVLGSYEVPSSILRVPITFPPDPFDGYMLSAMCVPDLQGSQGSFTYFSTAGDAGDAIGGQRVALSASKDGVFRSAIPGPPNPMRKDAPPMKAEFSLQVDRDRETAVLRLGKKKVTLETGVYSDWLPVEFKMALGMKLRGICRFRLLEAADEVRVYVTPVNIDPERPILPISHPKFFAIFLAKLLGKYSTLGLAEDTWALNEGVLDEDAFLEQAWANHDEREAMFFEMLRRTPKGLITCVFDGTDRIQHMFMRYLDDGHPARASSPAHDKYAGVIEETYAKMDEMLGRVFEEVDPDDPQALVAVISDHGFETFRRGVNLNSWLLDEGYLVLEDGVTETGEWFRGVDWDKSKAFALGLGGIFLNVEGREAKGCVAAEDSQALADEIAAKLTGLRDEDVDAVAINGAYPSHSLYKGPYKDDAPDIIVGYAAGWRASWDGVRGIVNDVVFDDNTKAWSGDHCIDPELVPGVLIANRDLSKADAPRPEISDLAPTLLDMFGIPAPRYMDGKVLDSAS